MDPWHWDQPLNAAVSVAFLDGTKDQWSSLLGEASFIPVLSCGLRHFFSSVFKDFTLGDFTSFKKKKSFFLFIQKLMVENTIKGQLLCSSSLADVLLSFCFGPFTSQVLLPGGPSLSPSPLKTQLMTPPRKPSKWGLNITSDFSVCASLLQQITSLSTKMLA